MCASGSIEDVCWGLTFSDGGMMVLEMLPYIDIVVEIVEKQ